MDCGTMSRQAHSLDVYFLVLRVLISYFGQRRTVSMEMIDDNLLASLPT